MTKAISLDELTHAYFGDLKVALHAKTKSMRRGEISATDFECFLKDELNGTAEYFELLANELESIGEHVDINVPFSELGALADSLQAKVDSGELPVLEALKMQNRVAHLKRVSLINSLLDDYLGELAAAGAEFGVTVSKPDYWKMRETRQAEVQQQPAPMPDADILKRLVDTGFIEQNQRITRKTVYVPRKPVTALGVFDEIAKITGSEIRARNLMRQNMSGVVITLDRHRPKKNYTT
ncbi:MAG: hypothetical protein LBR23_01890 [Spirochaetaceae bacterium]|jgi:hypothetical protein|nr:hypothetical protein [Spirochaetaceae bacterium]